MPIDCSLKIVLQVAQRDPKFKLIRHHVAPTSQLLDVKMRRVVL